MRVECMCENSEGRGEGNLGESLAWLGVGGQDASVNWRLGLGGRRRLRSEIVTGVAVATR